MTATAAEILRERFLERVKRNPSYSLRALARDLGVSPAFVSQVFSGKSKLSLKRAIQFSECLKLDDAKAAQLFQAVTVGSARDEKSRGVLKSFMTKRGGSPAFHSVDIDRFKTIADWYHVAILDLTTTDGFKPEIRWIAKRLKISAIEARVAVERLERLGMLEIKDGKWIKTQNKFEIPTDRSYTAMRTLHRQMIEKALEHLKDGSEERFTKRDITGTTMAIDLKKLPEARAMIREFRHKLAGLLTEGECTEVYQLNVQLFNLTEGDPK